ISWSTICANASISVTPGSETLWSVHSGHRCWTSRFASSTRSWKCRSSRLGAGSTMSPSPFGGRQLGQGGGGDRGHGTGLLGNDIEREHQVADVVGASDRVVDVDVQRPQVSLIEADQHVLHVDAGLPQFQGIT